MISHSEALEIVLSTKFRTQKEFVDVSCCLNRILAEDMISPLNMPPFDKSMVDGYAILRNDITNELIIDGIVAAGDNADYSVKTGHCVKVMTGAPVPAKSEMVIMVEETEILSNGKLKINNLKSSSNISPKAEDIAEGDIILKEGTKLLPFHCGILATIGVKQVPVYKLPNVGIIVTGNEIIEPGNELNYGQIYNSNAYQLLNNCKTININATYSGIAGDTYEETESIIKEMLKSNDVLIITGGVSMGDYDYVAPVLKNSGMNVRFDSIAAQPGRPLVFAENGEKFCFGMPGNPVSGLVLFETIVKPFLHKIMNHGYKANIFPFALARDVRRKKASRKSYYPVVLNDDNTVSAIEYHGSAHLNAYSTAFGIFAMEIGVTEIKAGEFVNVRQL
jgi:molybdopterin molybdotransferase